MKTTHFLSTAILLAVTVSACGKGKVAQCNEFVDEANKSQSAFVAIEAAVLNPTTMKTRTTQIEGSVTKLKALQLPDAKLAAFRDQYATGLTTFGKAATDLSLLGKDDKNVDKHNKIVDDLNKLSDSETKLIDDINGYCSK
jgi:hypothetical protein